MRSFLAAFTATAVASLAVIAADQAAPPSTVKLTKAAFAATITTDQRDVVTPEAGQQFLWVSATLSAAQPIDLTKVAFIDRASSYPLVGVDSVWDGDPKQFSMIAPIKLKTGKTREPLEETRSEGTVALAFTPGKLATLTVKQPPQKVCLVFLVPQAVHAGDVKGLGAAALPLPAMAAGKL